MQGAYLDLYLAALVANGVPAEQCRADDARTDLLRMTLMLYQLRLWFGDRIVNCA
jgi:hypothetical protein